jgi:hypothetical protein
MDQEDSLADTHHRRKNSILVLPRRRLQEYLSTQAQPSPGVQTLRTSASFAFKIYNKKSGPHKRTLRYMSCMFCK